MIEVYILILRINNIYIYSSISSAWFHILLIIHLTFFSCVFDIGINLHININTKTYTIILIILMIVLQSLWIYYLHWSKLFILLLKILYDIILKKRIILHIFVFTDSYFLYTLECHHIGEIILQMNISQKYFNLCLFINKN